MRKKIIFISLITLIGINAYAELDFSAYKGRSSGGTKQDVDAYKDGVAPIKINSPLISQNPKNILSDLTKTYGEKAKKQNMSVLDYVMNYGSDSDKSKIETTSIPAYTETLTSSKTINIPACVNPITVNIKLIGGGGGAQFAADEYASGGGTAGSIVQKDISIEPNKSYNCIVGQGGPRPPRYGVSYSGGNTSCFGVTANGGTPGCYALGYSGTSSCTINRSRTGLSNGSGYGTGGTGPTAGQPYNLNSTPGTDGAIIINFPECRIYSIKK